MNARERFLETALFGNPDKVPLNLGDVRPATLKRWINEGFPEKTSVSKFFGFDVCGVGFREVASSPSEGLPWSPSTNKVNLGPIPPFEYKIIKEDERYRVWVDNLGIKQMGFLNDWKNGWSGFATRVFIDFPVKSRKDFLEVKKRYDPKTPDRYPRNWSKFCSECEKSNYPVLCTIHGPFWWTRDMMGLKEMCLAFYKEPELIMEIMNYCAEFHAEVLKKVLENIEIDCIILNEDMAYKNGPMISPNMVKRFMVPAYKSLVKFFRSYGVKVILVDSDGNVEQLIPIWLELGINGITPCEVAAGMNVVDLRRKYPRLVMMGGLDKRELSKDKEAIEKELMSKVPKLVETKGYFPGVDHAVPPDVSLENFTYFVFLLKKLCGW
ncbi:MAG: uroporphyrinogen decarboxylase family protein [Thermoproteota archaeon]